MLDYLGVTSLQILLLSKRVTTLQRLQCWETFQSLQKHL